MILRTHERFRLSQPEVLLQLYLLGPPEVQWEGQALTIPRRQTRALLYYLAAHDRPVSRQQLAALFWGGLPENEAHRNLTRLLTHLRRSLPGPEFFVQLPEQIGLDPQQTWTDVKVLSVAHARRYDSQSLALLEQAQSLFKHSFLKGFDLPENPDFDRWLTIERQVIERRYLEILATLIEAFAGPPPCHRVASAQSYHLCQSLLASRRASRRRAPALDRAVRCSR